MAPDELYRDRGRAGSFGSVAEQYDRYRAGYPDGLIDDLAEMRPARVLDVGCGTGKVAVALIGRGFSVLGVEPDERMAGVARRHGVDVQVAAFETWDGAGQVFDLVTCGDAWHWIDPDLGVDQVAEVLTVGGTVARFWTAYVLDEHLLPTFAQIYRRYAPEIAQVWRPQLSTPRVHATQPDRFARSGRFTPVDLRAYPWERALTADEWVGFAATISDHQRLGPDRLTAVLGALHETIDQIGGTIHARCDTYALLSRKIR
jgi:SAM-dependent methyltransferase